jgi:hypothetical protein
MPLNEGQEADFIRQQLLRAVAMSEQIKKPSPGRVMRMVEVPGTRMYLVTGADGNMLTGVMFRLDTNQFMVTPLLPLADNPDRYTIGDSDTECELRPPKLEEMTMFHVVLLKLLKSKVKTK